MKRICVFCGSHPGRRPEYIESAKALAHALLRRKIGLVYGGASIGLMGVIADAMLEGGGNVIGVIPKFMVDRELAHPGLSGLHIVDTMHSRKATMATLADAFIALPGGFGTLEELSEVLTWRQIRLHQKPVGLLNIASYFDALLEFVTHGEREGFIKTEYLKFIAHDHDAERLVEQIVS
jgi:uncharacterized protein (TIGR00730 family)